MRFGEHTGSAVAIRLHPCKHLCGNRKLSFTRSEEFLNAKHIGDLALGTCCKPIKLIAFVLKHRKTIDCMVEIARIGFDPFVGCAKFITQGQTTAEISEDRFCQTPLRAGPSVDNSAETLGLLRPHEQRAQAVHMSEFYARIPRF